MNNIPFVWAHRGASGSAPENTLVAFKRAIDLGADGIELDIQLTKDDEIVVCHDEKIDRTSDGKGWLKDYTLEELRTFNFNQQFPEYGPQSIPTMREVLELIKPTNLVIDIELKTSVIYYEKLEEKIVELIKEYEMEDRVNYSSFNHYTCVHLHEVNPNAEVGFLYWDAPIGFPEYAKHYGANAINPVYANLYLMDTVEKAKENNLKIYVWDVFTEEEMLACRKLGVDAIITNYPELARNVYKER